ncbi:MAG: hypothetical protein Q8S33_31975 [Myxococcales bacterium]|nr:hypothetical protein [Myxococcales bacterium]MDP3505000.1 hypothetical protein [Myxococcales bacterium]
MAAKKKTAAKKPVAKAKKAAPAKQRAAVKLLTSLPPLDERRRRVYRAAFTDEQCDAWGKRTKAENVEGEAERFVGTLDSILKKGDIGGYSRYRLSWLCHLVGELNDAVDADGADSADSSRTERAAAVAIADKARKRIVNGLLSVALGNKAFTKQITDRNESNLAPHALESTLTGLLQLAVQARRSEDGALLSDDAGLTEEFLSSVSAITEALRESNEATYSEDRGNDSARTNRIEGRVLREMAFALTTMRRAREAGDAVPSMVPGKNLLALTRPQGDDDRDADAPAPPAK